jgi:hypothetical protein
MLGEYFQYIIGKFGVPRQAIPLAPASRAEISRRLPPELVEFLSEYGLGSWFDGRFQFCNLLRFQSIVDLLLEGDAELRPERTAMFGYSAFGEIVAWNQDHGRLKVDLPYLSASIGPVVTGGTPDQAITSFLAGIGDFDYGDCYEDDVEGAPLLFERVRKAHGPLQLGEVYGFFPALELGGRAHVETARRVKALEHFAILAQLGPATLFEYPNGRRVPIRQLGPQGG